MDPDVERRVRARSVSPASPTQVFSEVRGSEERRGSEKREEGGEADGKRGAQKGKFFPSPPNNVTNKTCPFSSSFPPRLVFFLPRVERENLGFSRHRVAGGRWQLRQSWHGMVYVCQKVWKA